MPRSRKGGRKKRRRGRSVIPGPVKKGIRDINKVTSRVARGIDKLGLKVLKPLVREVTKVRPFPGLRGGFPSAAVRGLRNPGIVSATAKKGGRKIRRGGRKIRRGGRKTRRGGRKSRRGGRKSRRGGRRNRR